MQWVSSRNCDWHGKWALALFAQRACGVSTLGETQKLSGHGPEQLALGDSAWMGELGKMNSRALSNLNHSVIPFLSTRSHRAPFLVVSLINFCQEAVNALQNSSRLHVPCCIVLTTVCKIPHEGQGVWAWRFLQLFEERPIYFFLIRKSIVHTHCKSSHIPTQCPHVNFVAFSTSESTTFN